MDISHVTWRKASYSGGNGGGCVEVGVWRKSSRSGANGGDCIEVATPRKPFIAVRDSKDPDGRKLLISSPMWQMFAQRVRTAKRDLREG
jgi:Domain of unknown function (DUF397)